MWCGDACWLAELLIGACGGLMSERLYGRSLVYAWRLWCTDYCADATYNYFLDPPATNEIHTPHLLEQLPRAHNLKQSPRTHEFHSQDTTPHYYPPLTTYTTPISINHYQAHNYTTILTPSITHTPLPKTHKQTLPHTPTHTIEANQLTATTKTPPSDT